MTSYLGPCLCLPFYYAILAVNATEAALLDELATSSIEARSCVVMQTPGLNDAGHGVMRLQGLKACTRYIASSLVKDLSAAHSQLQQFGCYFCVVFSR